MNDLRLNLKNFAPNTIGLDINKQFRSVNEKFF